MTVQEMIDELSNYEPNRQVKITAYGEVDCLKIVDIEGDEENELGIEPEIPNPDVLIVLQ